MGFHEISASVEEFLNLRLVEMVTPSSENKVFQHAGMITTQKCFAHLRRNQKIPNQLIALPVLLGRIKLGNRPNELIVVEREIR